MAVELLEKCRCKGYYKKVNDGTFLMLDKKTLTADWMNSNCEKYKDCIVKEDVEYAEKTYFEYRKQNFTGVLVGIKELVIEGYIDAVYEDGVDVGYGIMPEKFYAEKRAKKTVTCGIVYYANNRKHYVPVEDIEPEA